MPKRVIIIDMIAKFIVKKFLPAATPEFHRITDISLLHIVSWAEQLDAEKVYDIAFGEVFPPRQIKDSKMPYDEWFMTSDHPKLPMVVREELIRAFRIHMASGRMDVLRLGALAERYAKRMMYVGLFLLFLILVF